MKKTLYAALLLFITASLLSSCSNKAGDKAKYIPKDASMVLIIDPQSLQDKMTKGNISVDSLFKKAISSDSSAKEHLAKFEEFKKSGVDWNEKYYFFMTQSAVANSQSMTFSLIGSLSDSAKFTAYLKSQDHLKGGTVKKEKDYSYLSLEDGPFISWNDKTVILSFNTQTNTPVAPAGMKVEHAYYQAPADKEAELKKQVTAYYTLKDDESVASIKAFKEMFSEKADGYLFTGSNSSLSSLNNMPIQLPGLQTLLKNNYSASTLNFADGKIVVKSTSYLNPDLIAFLKKYPGPSANTSLIENYPSTDIDGALLFSFSPKLISGLLDEMGVGSLVDPSLQKMGITRDDLNKCFKGDIGVVVSDLGNPAGVAKASHKMIVSAGIGDINSFNKIMDKVAEMGFVVKQNNGYSSGAMLQSIGVYLHTDDKNMVFASDSLTYVQYASKSGKPNTELASRFKGKSMAFFADVDKLLNFAQTMTGGNMGTDLSKFPFKDMSATTDNFDGSTIKGEVELRMKDEKQNSLVTLLNWGSSFADDMHKNMHAMVTPAMVTPPVILKSLH